MGRPLFSRSATSVRVVDAAATEAPFGTAPGTYPYAKWSLENAFDPDSDEFSRDAVYEAFLNPEEAAAQASVAAHAVDAMDLDTAETDSDGLMGIGRSLGEGVLSDPELSSSGSSSGSSESGRTTPLVYEPHVELRMLQPPVPTTATGGTPVPVVTPSATGPISVPISGSATPTGRPANINTSLTNEPRAAWSASGALETPVSPEAAGRVYVAGDMVAQFGALFGMMMNPPHVNNNAANAAPGGISRARSEMTPNLAMEAALAAGAPVQQSVEEVATRSINRQALYQAVSRVAEQLRISMPDELMSPLSATAGSMTDDDLMADVGDDEQRTSSSVWPIAIPARPTTPPNMENSLPSPGVTPQHIYTWPHATTSASPLPNRSARVSLARLPAVSPMHVTL